MTCLEELTLSGINFCIQYGLIPYMDKGEGYFSLHDAFHARINAAPTREGELRVRHYEDGLLGKPFNPNPSGELYAGHQLNVKEQYEAWFLGTADAECYYSAALLSHIRAVVK